MIRLTTRRLLQLAILLIAFSAIIVQAALVTSNREQSQPQPQPNRAVSDGKYAGDKACAECHADKVKSQEGTPMAKALSFARDSEILKRYPHMQFSQGPYSYRIDSEAGRTTLTVANGVSSISEPVEWAFGLGNAGQTFVFTHKGKYIEGRVSYYSKLKGLAVTVGDPLEIPRSLEDALGRPLGTNETRNCFGCHASRAVVGDALQVDRLVPGVTCESCHGPGADHIAAMKKGDVKDDHIFNPGSLNTYDLSNFCGACHRTWAQVGLMGLRGVVNVRFQPYRLTNSKCYDTDEPRISCVACHDPHEAVRRDASYYDSKCTACHNQKQHRQSSGKRTPETCPVGTENCVSCHMPKYELPGGHYMFTDHEIRVVREGDPYPD